MNNITRFSVNERGATLQSTPISLTLIICPVKSEVNNFLASKIPFLKHRSSPIFFADVKSDLTLDSIDTVDLYLYLS